VPDHFNKNERNVKFNTEKIKYSKVRKKFLEENEIDIVSLFVFGKFQSANIVHHSRGRRGFNLVDVNTFIATTHEGDRWIHKPSNKGKAKELGFLV
jgi:hypothetical protein